jgi:signal recognition particle subunit SEC65
MQAAPVGQQVLTPEQRAEIMAKMRSAHTIYPQYIDATLSPEQGRRTTLQHAVAHPTLDEIFQALKHMGFTTVFCDPRKSLPKSQSQPYCIPPLRGVMKVVIKDGPSEGAKAAVVAKYPNESSVLRGIADFIKAIPDRQVIEQGHAQRYAIAAAEAGANAIVQGANKKIKKPKRQRLCCLLGDVAAS